MENCIFCIKKGAGNHPVASRGLCFVHYSQALGGVKRGETTWGDLEKRGLAKAQAKPGRSKAQGAFNIVADVKNG